MSLQLFVIIILRVVDVNQSFHIFYNTFIYLLTQINIIHTVTNSREQNCVNRTEKAKIQYVIHTPLGGCRPPDFR